MMNLVEQAPQWLQLETCRVGKILDRTEAIIKKYRSYLNDNMEEITHNTGLSASDVLGIVNDTEKKIRQIVSAFLRGNQIDALNKAREMTKSMKLDVLSPGKPLYKCRENKRLFHYSKNEMFHIPYDKRYLVGNQRFSLSGLPCLYLGGSSYICWEELGRKEFSTSNFCGYSLKKEIKLFDLLLPETIEDSSQIMRIVLTLACSLVASRDDFFKPEYILPQCLLHSLINRSYYSHSLFCIRYYSSHWLNGDADYFAPEYTNTDYLPRFVNYVFPAASSKSEGYNESLLSLFNQTETVSLMRETLLNPDRPMNSIGEDAYLKSQFGLMDAILDEKLGFKPKREEGEAMIIYKSDPGKYVTVEVDE